MFNPMYKKSRLITGNPESNVAICCLWTKCSKIAEKIDKNNYAVIGQLFSAERGLDLLVRNLLSNPNITNIIITGTDFSKSGVVLKDFFEKGFEKGETKVTKKPAWIAKSEYPGYIDLDVPEDALNTLRESINVTVVADVSSFDFSSLKQPEKKREKKVFEKKEDEIKHYPGSDIGYFVQHKNVVGAWLQILDTILKFGKISGTHYDDNQKEIMNLISVITDEDPYSFHITDFLPENEQHIKDYLPKITTDFKEEGTSYTYGSRMRSWFGVDQVKEAIKKLARSQESRAVVINLWDSKGDLTIGGSPCLNHIWLRIKDGKLHMTCTIRSNDMFGAYPENAFGLRSLQEVIRKELVETLEKENKEHDIKLGHLIINSQSAHIYDDCWERAQQIVDMYYDKYMSMHPTDPTENQDPRGSFQIELDNGEIVVNYLSTDGTEIKKLRGKNAAELRDIIARENIISLLAHAIDIGMELQKAEIALKSKKEYNQDQNIDL